MCRKVDTRFADARYCYARPRKVPTASSGCRGTTQPIAPCAVIRLSTTTPALANLSETQLSSARMTSAPDTRGSLGIAGLEHGHERTAGILVREFL